MYGKRGGQIKTLCAVAAVRVSICRRSLSLEKYG